MIPPLRRANLVIERSSTVVLILTNRTDASRRAWMSFAHRLAMALLCPICKSPAQELSRARDARGFYCTAHGHFKVADTIAVDEYYTRAEWEVALRSAKHKAMEGEWPVIRPGDFFR